MLRNKIIMLAQHLAVISSGRNSSPVSQDCAVDQAPIHPVFYWFGAGVLDPGGSTTGTVRWCFSAEPLLPQSFTALRSRSKRLVLQTAVGEGAAGFSEVVVLELRKCMKGTKCGTEELEWSLCPPVPWMDLHLFVQRAYHMGVWISYIVMLLQ